MHRSGSHINRWIAGSPRRWARLVGTCMVGASIFVLAACGGSAKPPTASGAQQESVTVTLRTASLSATRQPTATVSVRTASPTRATPSITASASFATGGTTTAQPGASGGPEPGQYDCYDTLNSPTRYVTSFTLNVDGTYSTDEGAGKYTYNATNLRVLFTSGPYAAPPPFLGAYDPRSGTIYLQGSTTEGPGFPCDR